MKLRTIFSIGLLISFFLPWLDIPYFAIVYGYEIPTSLTKLSHLFISLDSKNIELLKLSYFIFLIPICSVFNIIKELTGLKVSYFLNEFIFGIIASIILFVLIIIVDATINILSLGYYFTALFSVLGICSTYYGRSIKRQDTKVKDAKEEHTQETLSLPEKTNLLNQLSQLNSLKEKQVITEEIYEQEKAEILVKFQKQNKSKSEIGAVNKEPKNVYQDEYDPNFEELFNKKSPIKKNKILFIIIVLIVIFSSFLYYKSTTEDDTEDVEIELKNNVSTIAAKEITLILDNDKKIRLNKFPESDPTIGDLDNEIRDSSIRCYMDIDKDKTSELITQYFTGGAHCCYRTDIFIKVSDKMFRRVFSYPGIISVKKNGLSLYFYEDIGYFNTCYACGVDIKIPFIISPTINLNFAKNSFDFAKKNDKLNADIEENLKILKAKGIPNMSNESYSQDDGTRKEYAINIVAYFFNLDRNLANTKELFYNYYNHDDKNKIWNELEEYLNVKNSSLKKQIKFKTK